jgi:hypothetical protein
VSALISFFTKAVTSSLESSCRRSKLTAGSRRWPSSTA